MSYSFDGVNDTMTGAFTSTYADPVTLACFIKVTDHLVNDALVGLGNSNSTVNDSYQLRSTGTDNQWGAVSIGAAGSTSTATNVLNIDGVWAGIVGKFSGDALRDVYVQALANTGQSTESRAVADVLQFVRLGESFAGALDFTGLMAEVAIWNSALSDADITSYLAGTAASQISAANLIGYWPLSASNATQANEGVDTGGDLTVAGATFNADHPTITIPSTARGRMLLTGIG